MKQEVVCITIMPSMPFINFSHQILSLVFLSLVFITCGKHCQPSFSGITYIYLKQPCPPALLQQLISGPLDRSLTMGNINKMVEWKTVCSNNNNLLLYIFYRQYIIRFKWGMLVLWVQVIKQVTWVMRVTQVLRVMVHVDHTGHACLAGHAGHLGQVGKGSHI